MHYLVIIIPGLVGILIDNINDVHNHIILNVVIHGFEVLGVRRSKVRGNIDNIVITKLVIFRETEEGLESIQNGKVTFTGRTVNEVNNGMAGVIIMHVGKNIVFVLTDMVTNHKEHTFIMETVIVLDVVIKFLVIPGQYWVSNQ